ncbi:DUF2079 domain-containing protein [Kitasatospora sp. GP82]|uniref:DUF2079 domain-containing protein n=1 Tax=Kitasatospora sp. GP82 TaxID=3035089 RepID=UPI002473454C|nr:DUF2079 domain-containing protein [Kitasatospora sp. GP82]MDH6128522.1 putative membrane protein [Kitasatospora sp. GP82]
MGTGFQQWTTLQVGGFDLGIFDQGIRGYAHFGLPISPAKSYHHEFPPSFSLLGDHFSPILALLAPLYWFLDDPRSLIIGQAALFAAGIPVIRRIAARCFIAQGQETRLWIMDLAGLVYGLGWPLLVAAQNGFHEVAFAVPLTLLMFEGAMARRYWQVLLAGVMLCCTKEDLGLVVGAYGAVLFWRSRHSSDRSGIRTGLALFLGGPAATVVAIHWLIPAMGGQPGYYWNYDALGPNAGAAFVNVVSNPLCLFEAAFSTPLKPLLILWLLGTTFLLPICSATAWCTLPLVAERILSSNPNHWSVAHHYDAFLWPILVTAALEAVGSLSARERSARTARWLGLAAAAVSLAAALPFGLSSLADPNSWRPGASEAALIRASSHIPDGASVEADNLIVPRLTARTDVVLVDETPRGRDYVLIRTNERSFPFATDREQVDRARLLLAHGYEAIWSDDGVLVLHRVSSEPIPGEHVPGQNSSPVQDIVPSDVGHSLFHG